MMIRKVSYRAPSASGGKDYHQVLILAEGNRALLIQRWGKAHSWGTGWNVVRGSYTEIADEFANKEREKFSPCKGYKQFALIEKKVINEREFKAELGQYWPKLDPDDLKFLSDEIDTTGAAAHRPTTFAQRPDGSWKAETAPIPTPPEELERQDRLLREREEERARQETEAAARRFDDNPAWGMF
jgi:hypothetical protein